ncbi:laminin subunit alpha-5 isoform X2 [Spea bombifrons]|uniref:laminin subunit alpha-5 isoform X2 n=1 Tax=Spea bombifrons TaxID=233779 RepID=UPI002349B78C|nr:laminin subunit alpha-5 isoform X2 [Spea bombifrons]
MARIAHCARGQPGLTHCARGQPGLTHCGPAVPRTLSHLLLVLCLLTIASAQELLTNGVNGYSLHPPYFNLAEGTRISATATCGEGEDGRAMEELYCKLVGGPVSGDPSQTIQGQYCDICMAHSREKAHPITNAIDGTERWWQSPPLSRGLENNEVNVTLDLGQVFHVAYVWIKFANSPRPDLWVLERSTDYGATYQPWQYFASSKRDCIEVFGRHAIDRIINDDDVICTTEYSRIVPLENGEVVVSLVIGRPGSMNFTYSPVLRNFTKATHIRLRFLRTNTLLGHLMGKTLRDPTVTRRYYYSIKDISIGGRCVCNGHAEVCNARDPVNPYRLQCVCQHNTCGPSCDSCCPGYHQLPWKPATMDNANECEPCNCNGHAHDCYYDADVDQRRASMNRQGQYLGGGVCVDCQHNTDGVNCERCRLGYYKSPDHPTDSPYTCQRCNCESEYMDGTCEDLTGRCYCKPNYTGEDCRSCAEGYTDFPECYPVPDAPSGNTGEQILPAGEIINCDCYVAGTAGNACRKDPVIGACVCKPNFRGEACDMCAPRYFGPNCQECSCTGPGVYDGSCDKDSGQCVCRDGFEGFYCDGCSPGFFNYPLCQLCGCSPDGTLPEGCDANGRCFCKPEYDGPRCEQCIVGYYSYPHCQACSCDPRGSVDNNCTPTGHCRCHPSYAGPTCNQCSPGFYGFPSCTPCHCSQEGSLHSICDPLSGQCRCRHGVAGLKCDTCAIGTYGFPNCEVGPCNPSGSSSVSTNPSEGSCECREHVEGASCEKCKPLYWNLVPENPQGCTRCRCGFEGTINGVEECQQVTGQCFCKPNICSRNCNRCKEGFYNLEPNSYFGCQGCQCDIGGSIGLACHEKNGDCQCRDNVEGPRCNQPTHGFFFPDLHHLKYEVEDGVAADGRPVRFGYNPLEFENFSWRGYAQMSPIQPKVVLTINVTSPDLFRVVLRYVNRGSDSVTGKVSFREDRKSNACANCSEQSKTITFPPSPEPSFVTVPQGSFGEPFVLNPNMWSVTIEVEDVLLDYLVLLPSAYYEAPILQMKVTEPCTYLPAAEQSSQNCLMYKYLTLDGFPSSKASEGICHLDNNLPRPCQAEQITPRHPPMVMCYGSDVDVQFRMPVPHPGRYVLLVEYSNEEDMQNVSIVVNSAQRPPQHATFTFYPCKFSFLCRGVALDSLHRAATFDLSTEANIRFTADRTRFHLAKIYLIPRDQFTMEYIEPRVHCISAHGSFSPSSGSCVPSRFQKPSQSVVLTGGNVGSVPSNVPLSQGFLTPSADGQKVHPSPGHLPPTAVDATKLVRLQSPQSVVGYNGRVQSPGRYAIVIHYYQPSHPTFTIEVLVHGGRVWQGSANATYCPHGYGCRSLVVSENQVVLDMSDNDLTVTVRVPDGKIIWLEYVLVIPEDSYSSSYLVEEPLDKSYSFISRCGANSFQSSPAPSKFCRDAAISLSLFYNNGAQPCHCHEVGALGTACEPYGGQCSCRPHVIGRDCSRCATGYWGFPNCRPCECGSRLCNEVTGQCICPPRTIKPECTACQPQTFGCHALIGCEECDCSKVGLQNTTEPGCDVRTGQCTCKENIMGRRCEKCATGYYGYPNCKPCDCNRSGTEPSVCDPISGQCHCKENVEGTTCDRCRLGTFYLDPENPKGCTRCFCFGATDRCHTASKYRAEFSDMNGWVLVGGDRQEVETSVQLNEGLVEADLSDVPDVYQEFYWISPSSYLGDRVSSYGGLLRYELHSEALRGDPLYVPVERRADVILKGNQMTIAFLEAKYPAPGENHQGQVHLLEGNFIHTQTYNPVSREDLMMVLANLEQLQIRALNSQSSSAVSLRRVVLEIGQGTSGRDRANNVELCMCPANYRGDSCQECAPGFYRDTKGLFLGKCVPCNCSGHSDQCLPGTGGCVKCQHNTEGERCERCKEGFVANRTADGSLQCIACPCPLSVHSNNFAIGCVQRGFATQCLCKPGYAGASCERCAPGYYGNPMVIGSSCRPCECNGNTDSNMLFSDCDPLSGACSNCMFNTAGPRCEVCAPGYHGDAIAAKNCTKCDCSACGTESCDPRTGRCQCKPGVTGARCDHCEPGYYGFDGCNGCQRCSCGAGSADTTCDAGTGQCRCLPGVTGPRCQQCAPGYWGFGPSGCLTCDSCVVTLLEDLQRMGDFIPIVRDQLTNLSVSSIAWTRLGSLNNSIANITDLWLQYQGQVNGIKDKADDLEDDSISLSQDLDALQDKMNMTKKTANAVQIATKATNQKAKDLKSKVKSLHNISLGLIDQLKRIGQSNSSNVTSTEEFIRIIMEVESMMREMRAKDFKHPSDLAEKELDLARKLLDRVKAELVKALQTNQELLSETKRRLDTYNSEVMDLRDALNEAVNKTRQTEDLNTLNQNNLEENTLKINDLQKQHREMVAALKMAEDSLVQVSDLLQMIESLKEEYEKLAAGLDGARGPILDKVKKFSPASGKIPIVEKAEMHAKELGQLAKNLFSAIGDSNQDTYIQKAINASNAYSSIIDSVKQAEKAAKDANRAAGEAVKSVISEDLGRKGQDLKKKSTQLEETAKEAERELSGDVLKKLEEARKNLLDTREKKARLQSDLSSVIEKLGRTRDNVTDDITSAKFKAAEANDTANKVEATLTDIKKNLEQWKEKYGGLQNEDVNKAMEEAKTSVSNLENTIPLLLDKLNKLEKRQGQNGSISDSIQRIRHLISQARDAASKVKVPVKFNGTSGVQLRTPENLHDLAAYTSLKLHVQNSRPQNKKKRQAETDQGRFVMFLGHDDGLGDYLGLVLKGNKLNFVYQLGDESPTFLTTSEEIKESFVTVSIERILQYGQMSTTVFSSQILHEKKGDSTAVGQQGLLNLDPQRVVFYVGGYPEEFVPPDALNYPRYLGCIEMDTLNEKPISLYDFERTFQLDTTQEKPCARSKSTSDPWLTDGSYFDGTGYAEIKLDTLLGSSKRFEMDIRLVSYNGILFFLDAEEQFLCLAVQEGKLTLHFDIGEGLQTAKPVDSSLVHVSTSTAKVVQVILAVIAGKKRIFVRLERLNVFMVEYENGKLESAQYFYLGGVSPNKLPDSLKEMFPGGGSIRGCMKGLKALGKYVDLKRMNTTGVSYGCTSDLLIARAARFHGHGFLNMSLKNVPNLQEDFFTGFGFQTSQSNALMYSHSTEGGSCQVSIQDGHVSVKVLSTELTSKSLYADGMGHYLTLYSNKDKVWFYLDDQLQETRQISGVGQTGKLEAAASTFLLGGFPETTEPGNLTGCISNVFVKRKSGPQTVLDLIQNQQSQNVTMSCKDHTEDQAQEIRALLRKDKLKARQRKLASLEHKQSEESSCVLPQTVKGAMRFGGSPFSHLEFGEIPGLLRERFHFSLDVRLNASHGLIFYTGDEQHRSFLALSVSNSRFVVQIDVRGKKIHVTSKDKYNDGQWHTVFFGREKNKLRLVVDGLKAKSRTLPSGLVLPFTHSVYVGGLPAQKVQPASLDPSLRGFSGCLRNLKMDGRLLNSPNKSMGVTPCYEGTTEKGLFFSDGGFLTLENLINLGEDLELKLEIRPMRPSGIILHLETKDGHYLTLSVAEGKVTAAVNVGAGEYSTSVGFQQSLCDGQWHTIAVTKGRNVIQLDVDTEGNHTVGTSPSHPLRSKGTLYVGAVPESRHTARHPAAPSPHSHYHGCMRNLVINRTAVDVSKSGAFTGSVGANICPAL